MKFRYPVSSSMRSRAAADGRSRRFLLRCGRYGCARHGRCVPPCRRSKAADYQVEFGGEIRLACGGGPGIGTHHQQATFRKRAEIPAGQMTEPAPDSVTHDRPAHGLTHHEADPRGLVVAGPAEQVARDQRPPCAAAAAQGLARTPSASASVRLREAQAITAALAGPHQRQARVAQTLIRARPLRRRAARTARPARVRMRSRNPCVFARRRLFGWNVRLLTWDSRWTGRGRCGHRASHAGCAHAEARPGDSRTNERYAGRVPPVKPAPGVLARVLPGQQVAACSSLHNPRRLVKQPRRYPPQHFPFAKRAPKSGPRLWTAVLGEGIRDREASGISQSPAAMGRAAAPSATCTTCGKTC